METLRKSLAVICGILFVISAVVALFLFNFDRNAFTADVYQKAFARQDFYNKLPSVMADAMTSVTTNQSNFPVVLQGVGSDTWQEFFRTLLPPQTLKTMGDDVLNSTFAYINMETDSAQLNLAPLKANFSGELGVQAVFSILNKQPECTFLQVTQMTIDLLSSGQLQLCNPPQELVTLLTPVIQGQLQFTASVIPDQVTIIDAPQGNDPRPRLKFARFLMRFSPILPLLFLFGLAIFAVRSFKDWLGWWGLPLFISGGLAFVMSLVGAPIIRFILQGVLASRMPHYLPPILSSYAGDLASAMVNALLRPVLWQGFGLGITGFAMTLISFFIKNQKPTPANSTA